MPHNHNHNHSHDRHHGHSHDHDHHPKNYDRAFTIGLVLNIVFVTIEVVYGIFSHSLALIADAGHNFSDVLALLMSWAASVLARRIPTLRYTYGLRRSSILVALFNAIVLLLVVGAIAWEAIQRFQHPEPVNGSMVIGVAAIGIAINTITALMFMSGSKNDLNIRGAFLHMASDALVSLGAVLAGITILLTGWLWIDPVISLVIVVVIVLGTWQLLLESVNLALDGVPSNIELLAVKTYLAELPNVAQVHDLHIWAMSTTETALTVHLVVPCGSLGDGFLNQVCQDLRDRFHIDHATIQLETGDPSYPCTLAPDHVV